MYLCGELVVYGTHGVCRIADVEQKRVDKKEISYLVLEPLLQPGAKYYIPQSNEVAVAKLRSLLDREQVKAMFADQQMKMQWIPEDNKRKLLYRQIQTNTDASQTIAMLRTLYAYRAEQQSAGRRLHQCDEVFLHEAEKLLSNELSVVLEMNPQQALEYIRSDLCE